MHEKTLKKTTLYEGRILDLEVQDIETANGVIALREIVRHAHAVAALALLPDERFVFVRQFRKAIETEIVELVAGLREKGEEPEQSIRRELLEETGYEAEALIPLGQVHPSPGYTDESIHLFFAYLNPVQQACHPDEDEHIEVVYMTEAEVIDYMARGEVRDAKWLAAWAHYMTFLKAPEETVPSCAGCAPEHQVDAPGLGA